MQIQYYGLTTFKIITKPAGRATDDVTLYVNGLGDRHGLRAVYGTADVLVNSYKIENQKELSLYKGNPVVLDCPGEYAVKGMNMIAIPSNDSGNAIYIFEAEDIKIAHLGYIKRLLDEKQYEAIDGVDILCIPVGGNNVVDAKEAVTIIRKIEPSIILPMYYKQKNVNMQLDGIKKFCDEIGVCDSETVSKLTCKKKDLEDKHMEVIQLESQR